MSFTSLHFLVFFPIVARLYFVVPYRHRWVLLTIASYYFYMSWRPWYALLLLFQTVVAYACGLAMGAETSQTRRRCYLIAGCSLNLAVLFVFKYFDFLNTQTRDLLARFGIDYSVPNLDLVLPIAISFITFQGIGYLVDVYRRDIPPERHFGIFTLFKVYFPQLVAGPIERAAHFLPQLRRLMTPDKALEFDHDRAIAGLRLVLRGFVKKLVVADNLAQFVDPIYNNPSTATGGALAMATVAFAFQIYFDFSAYTDIARGCSRVLGLELLQNFRRPYLAQSVAEFWKRWHISLTSWFRDYVYLPLGGNRVPYGHWIVNVLTVFVLSGLWHGANWTFVVWGALHGGYYIVSRSTERVRATAAEALGLTAHPALHAAWRIAVTFVLVCLAWMFFRANDVSSAFLIVGTIGSDAFAGLGHMLGLAPAPVAADAVGLSFFDEPRFYFACLGAALFMAWEFRNEHGSLQFASYARWQRWGFYYAACLAILVIGNLGNKQFIYFQF